MGVKDKQQRQNLLMILLVALTAGLIGCIALRIWEVDMSVPPGIGGDGTLFLMLSKSIDERGLWGIFSNPYIGAPLGSTLVDVPFFDFVLVVLVWISNRIGGGCFGGFYVIFIMTFILSAVSMSFLLLRFQISRVINFAVSLIFCAAPYHFYRSLGHITLSNYFTVPLGIYLAFYILEEDCNVIGKKRLKLRDNKNFLKAMIIALLVGFGQLYYSFFALMLMAVAAAYKIIVTKKIKIIWNEGLLLFATLFATFMGMFPKFLFAMKYTPNNVAGVRIPMEAELYGMKIIQLLLPVSYSRIKWMAELNTKYSTTTPLVTENNMSSLGIVASVGFIVLCGWLLYTYILNPKETKVGSRLKFGSLLVLVLILYCTIGGFGSIFSFFVTPQIRCVNRACIYISCLSLIAVAYMLQWIWYKKKKLAMTITVLILVVAMYDQVMILGTGWQAGPAATAKEYQKFFAQVQQEAGEEGMVYQLPIVSFPEAQPVNQMSDYTHFMGYLYTDHVKWSYGTVIGRENVAANIYGDDGISMAFVQRVIDNGYNGIYIDVYGYEDGGISINSFYQEVLGLTPIISSDGRLYYYNLGDLSE